ncbi:MAG: GH1 family beta-glucosidase [Lachnospiraceae bacterium]
MGFRKDFVWGAATSSYQVEGAAQEGGKGTNIWDVFCHTPGKIKDGSNADTACDGYHHVAEDVALMKELGVHAYRFSVDWARVLPEGTGTPNEEGLAFYSRLIDELLAAGITPYLTLYHWELPQALQERGGFLSPDFPDWFAGYAGLVAERFSDRVTHYFTFNEPQCTIGLGLGDGVHAPGLTLSPQETVPAAHHLLLAHGAAVQALRAAAKQPILIGFAPTSGQPYPLTESPADIEAARRSLFTIPEGSRWYWNVPWFSDPVILGRYPEEGLARLERFLPRGWEQDLAKICQPLDFYGQNIYNGWCVRADADGNPVTVDREPGSARTATGWPVTPKALYWGPRFLYERYQKPLYITENGVSCCDWVSLDGKVHDPGRIDFTQRYLRELRRAADDGVDVRGYFHWSLLDNFEWADGYTQRFGLIYVNYKTQQRIPKDSFYWYQQVIRTNGASL